MNRLEPRIRFEGFSDEWDKSKILDLSEINYGKDYKSYDYGNYPVYGTGGIITYINNYISKKDAIGIGRKGSINNPFLLNHPFWTVDTLFYCYNKGDIDLNFLLNLFKRINWNKYDESTGVPSLSKTNIGNVRVNITNKNEQEKIGAFFEKLDKLIENQESYLNLNKKLKKSLLQKLFPKEGEDRPELRFPGFNEKWEEEKLDYNTKIKIGYTPSTKNKKNFGGSYTWYSISDFNSKYINNSARTLSKEGLKEDKIVKKGSLLLSFKLSIGELAFTKVDCLTNEAIMALNFKNRDNEFMYYRLKTINFLKYANRAVQGFTINSEGIKSIQIKLPTLAEQEKIGSLFKSLDEKIESEEKKLRAYKDFKKSMLQKMFV